MDPVRFEQTFTVRRPPEDVFAFMVEPDNLAKWQTVKTYVTPLTKGPPRLGYRVREGTKVGPREWDQVVEFTEFDPGRTFGVRVIEGPESHGRWTFQHDDSGTRVHLEADMKAPKGLGMLFKWMAARQFRGYHENLRRELERP
jgi:ligand-binding SRPBCC domain-containing protein